MMLQVKGQQNGQPSKSGQKTLNGGIGAWSARTRRAKHFGFEATFFRLPDFDGWQFCSPKAYKVTKYLL